MAEVPDERSIDDVVDRMGRLLGELPAGLAARRPSLPPSLPPPRPAPQATDDPPFEDPAWVEAWDVVFADLYLDALEADLSPDQQAPRPWTLAFAAPDDLPPLRQVLLGINAHINFDLPQALLGVISDADFADPVLLERRRRDHERIDRVLAGRVAAEDDELSAQSAKRTVDRLLTPLNRRASTRFLREARTKVWHNAIELQHA